MAVEPDSSIYSLAMRQRKNDLAVGEEDIKSVLKPYKLQNALLTLGYGSLTTRLLRNSRRIPENILLSTCRRSRLSLYRRTTSPTTSKTPKTTATTTSTNIKPVFAVLNAFSTATAALEILTFLETIHTTK